VFINDSYWYYKTYHLSWGVLAVMRLL